MTVQRSNQEEASHTYKFFCAWEVEELDEAEVVSRGDVESGVRDRRTDDVGLLGIAWPHPHHLIAKHAGRTQSQNNLIMP